LFDLNVEMLTIISVTLYNPVIMSLAECNGSLLLGL